MKSIQETLFTHQHTHNLTQHEMAKMLSVSQATYNNWVNRKSAIDPKYYPAIAKICKVDVEQFISSKAIVTIKPSSFSEGEVSINALELYQRFTKNLEDQIVQLKDQIGELKSRLKEKDLLILAQTEDIRSLRNALSPYAGR